ncbi:hypothetical protein ACJBCE_36865 [Streptomyces sp. NBUL23]|uniref:hypothetical protein n=1 Tax=Streptomyces sp. NBUL23 TaxID=3381354 RepID=UPI003871B22E
MRKTIRSIRAGVGRLARSLRASWERIVGGVGIVESGLTTLRDRRLLKARHKALAASERTLALTAARQGCTHTPSCPPPSAPTRTAAVEIYADDVCVYLCNGIVLSQRQITAPSSPSGIYTTMPTKAGTP